MSETLESTAPLTKILPARPGWERAYLRATTANKEIGVDREAATIHGMVIAEEGPFRDGRGEFNRKAIGEVIRLGKTEPLGLKSRFTHPTLSEDGLGKHLGRVRGLRKDLVERPGPDGKAQELAIVRGDLHFDRTALDVPVGGGKPLATYIMDLAESDPEALGASLVLMVDEELRRDGKGQPLVNEAGQELPPLWHPKEIHAADVVGEGAATRSFLAVELDGLPDALVRTVSGALHRQFAGQPRGVVKARALAFLEKWLAWEYGEEYDPERDPVLLRKRLREVPWMKPYPPVSRKE